MRPVFIVGMYKSGTSWLLRILDCHPSIRGVKEIDLLKAGAGKVINEDKLLSREERLFGYFGANAWAPLAEDSGGDVEMRKIILRHMPSTSVKEIFRLPAEAAIDVIIELCALMLSPERSPWASHEKDQLLTIASMPRKTLIALYEAIGLSKSIYEAGDAFLDAITSVIAPSETLILKGADQIARYEYLKGWKPDAKKLIIVRDGRDVAISAMHYRRLMRSTRRAYVNSEDDYWQLLKDWASRVKMLLRAVGDEHLAIVRYEDLTNDFVTTIMAVFRWLGMPVATEIVTRIYRDTKFETLTNRNRGQSAPHIMRRGMVGEWKEALSGMDAKKAWDAIGEELAILGYGEFGELKPLPIPSGLLQSRESVLTA